MWIWLLTAALAGTGERQISLDTVRTHRTADDCWMAIDGRVYAVTTVLGRHPGGEAMVAGCGTDATELFATRPMGSGTSHSAAARAMLAPLEMGVLAEEDLGAGEEPERFGPIDAARWAPRGRPEARRIGVLPTARILRHRRMRFSFEHAFGIGDDLPTTNAVIGLAFGVGNWFDVEVLHATWTRDSGLHLKFALLDQHGRLPPTRDPGTPATGAPISLALQLGAGVRPNDDLLPESRQLFTYVQLPIQREILGHWLSMTLVPTVAILPREDDVVRMSLGGGLVLRPGHPFGFHGEVVGGIPGLSDGQLYWTAGIRSYTHGHLFRIWLGNSPIMTALEHTDPITGADGEAAAGWAIGFAFTRDFHL